MFVYLNTNTYKAEPPDCYDCDIVLNPNAKEDPFGQAYYAVGEEGAAGFTSWAFLQWNDNWYIWFGGEWVGYIPDSEWGDHFTDATTVAEYGEVHDLSKHVTTQMGNGIPGTEPGSMHDHTPWIFLSYEQPAPPFEYNLQYEESDLHSPPLFDEPGPYSVGGVSDDAEGPGGQYFRMGG